jgi:hypothetical protein
MLSPCDPVGSAMKAMQTEIENLTKEIDKVLQTKNAYKQHNLMWTQFLKLTSQISNGISGAGRNR